MCGNTKPVLQSGSPKGVGDMMNCGFALGHADVMTNNLSLVKTNEPDYSQKSCHVMLCGMDSTDKPFADIADRLRWHRDLEGLNQRDYAAKAGLKRAQLNNWESGFYRLSLDGALALRRTYGLSLDFMYEGNDDALPMTLRAAWRDRPEVRASR